VCGEAHEGLLHVGFAAPDAWSDRLRADPDSLLTAGLCTIVGRDHFVRGVVEIPVHDHELEFGWGVWVSHKRENVETYRSRFDDPGIGPFFGWLANEMRVHPRSTLNLKTMAHYRGGGLRPRILVEPSEHPLSRHQREGISLEDVWRTVHAVRGVP
jgi:hypothetical protein